MSALEFTTLRVVRFHGVGREREPIHIGPGQFCSGVNVVYGPNGSGKTTAALSLGSLLWPGLAAEHRPTLEGDVREGPTTWHVTLDAGHPGITPRPPPRVPPPEHWQRMYLPLHDLLRVSEVDRDLAEVIQAEIYGGLSLRRAASDLGFSDVIPGSAISERRDLLDARHRETAAADVQRDMRAREAKLGNLREQGRIARASLRQAELLEAVLDCRSAQTHADACRRMLADMTQRFPGVERYRHDDVPGGDLQQFCDLRHRLQDAREKQRLAWATEQRCREKQDPQARAMEESLRQRYPAHQHDDLEMLEAKRADVARFEDALAAGEKEAAQLREQEAQAEADWRDAVAVMDRGEGLDVATWSPPPTATLAALSAATERLRELENEAERVSRTLQQMADELTREQLRLGPLLTDEQLSALDDVGMDAFEGFLKDIAEVQGRTRALALVGQRAAVDPPPPQEDVRALEKAVAALEDWLGQPRVAPAGDRLFRLAIGVAWLLAAVILGLGMLLHPAFGILLMLPLAVVGLAYRWRPGQQPDGRGVLEARYCHEGLVEPPETWEEHVVTRRLDMLRDRLAAAAWQRRAADWVRQFDASERPELERAKAALEERERTVRAMLGVGSDMAAERLQQLAGRIARWQQARARICSAQDAKRIIDATWTDALKQVNGLMSAAGLAPCQGAATAVRVGPQLAYARQQFERWRLCSSELAAKARGVVVATEQRDARLAAINAVLGEWGGESVSDAAGATGQIARLRDRRRRYLEAEAAMQRAQNDMKHLAESIAGDRDERLRPLLTRLGLGPLEDDDSATMERLEEQIRVLDREHAHYAIARENAAQAESIAADREASLRRWDEFHEDLLALPTAELQTRCHDAQEIGETAASIDENMAEVVAEVRRLRQGHDLEAAVADRDKAVMALARRRDKVAAAHTGHMLVEYLRKRTQDGASNVLHRARRLFADITAQRYEIEVTDSGTTRFTARDTGTGRIHALDELSSGTRLQLLIAVRLAFLEEQEGEGPKLPLILDEALGNTDDRRAPELIKAILSGVRAGRQVVYFTARWDEVITWRQSIKRSNALTAGSPIPYAEVHLPTARPPKQYPASEPASFPPAVVPPVGPDYEAYGRALNVPRFDPWAPITDVHLWYLLHDSQALYQCLMRGLERWGHLEALLRNGDHDAPAHMGLSADPDFGAAAQSAAWVLTRFLDLWRCGRGRPVDREVLAAPDSSFAKSAHLDALVVLAGECSGDAVELVAQARDIRGFGAKRQDELRSYLESTGHIDSRLRIADTDLKSRLALRLATAAAPDRSAVPTPQRVDELLARTGLRGTALSSDSAAG